LIQLGVRAFEIDIVVLCRRLLCGSGEHHGREYD
jgi:hypothetical protein